MTSVGKTSARELEVATADVRVRWRSAIRENQPPEKVEELASLLSRLSNELRRRGVEDQTVDVFTSNSQNEKERTVSR